MTNNSMMNSTRRPATEMSVRMITNEAFSSFMFRPDSKIPDETRSIEEREERQSSLSRIPKHRSITKCEADMS